MSLKDMKDRLQSTIIQSDIKLKDELYTIKELAEMLKTSRQHIGKLIKTYNIETINIACKDSKKVTHRIKKSEVYKLRKELNL